MWLATLTRHIRSQSSSGTSTPPMAMIPALAQNRSTGPNASSVRRTRSTTSALGPGVDPQAERGGPSGAGDVGGDALGRVPVDIGQHHGPRPLGGEGPAQALADAPAAAGDDGDAAGQLHQPRPAMYRAMPSA